MKSKTKKKAPKIKKRRISPVKKTITELVESPKIHKYQLDVRFTMPNGAPIMTREMKLAAVDRLKKLDENDNTIYETRKIKNTFEELIYKARAFVSEEETSIYVPAEDHEIFLSKLVELEDWLYEDGYDAGIEEIEEKISEIEEVYQAGVVRKVEKERREEYYPSIQKMIKNLTESVPQWKEDKDWVRERHWIMMDNLLGNFTAHMENATKMVETLKDYEDPEYEFKKTFDMYDELSKHVNRVLNMKKPYKPSVMNWNSTNFNGTNNWEDMDID